VNAADEVRHLARDVQRFGLLSAASVVERYVDLVGATVGVTSAATAERPTDRPSDPSVDTDPTALVDSATRIADAYLGLLDATTRLVEPSTSARPCLLLEAVAPGGTTRATLWVHNDGPEPADALTVTMGALVAANGASLGPASVACTPSRLGGLRPHGSAQLDVTVHVPPDQPAGTYHGFVLVSLAPGDPVAVEVEVLSS
jgi:hypothetical protein